MSRNAWRIVAIGVVVSLCLLTARSVSAEDLDVRTNIELVRDLFNHVNTTRPSVVNARENTDIIRTRLECYAEHDDYTPRIRVCNNAYVKALLHVARTTIKSRPSLGPFVQNIGLCPVMYNLCVGQTENDRERCMLFERQCIDYTLDSYWRGAAQYSQQQYRSE